MTMSSCRRWPAGTFTGFSSIRSGAAPPACDCSPISCRCVQRCPLLRKRVIPCLDVMGGRVVKGVNFIDLRDEGDPVELAARYAAEGADEIAFLDIGAAPEYRTT